MRPLWFLTFRLLINSIRRALRHPARAIVFLLVAGFFGLSIVMNLLTLPHVDTLPVSPVAPPLPMHHLLALVMAVHALMIWSALSPAHSTIALFSMADVHFIFPSPLRRFPAFLFLLATRGLVTSTITMFLLAVVVFGVGSELLAEAMLGRSNLRVWHVWAYPAMYLLAFVGLLLVGMLTLLLDERHTGLRDRLRRVMQVVLATIALMLGWHAYHARARGEDPLEAVIAGLLHDPFVAVLVFPLRVLGEAAVAFYQGWTPYVTFGFLFWGGVVAFTLLALARNEHWLYDLGAKVASLTVDYRAIRQSPLMQAQEFVLRRREKRKRVARWRLFEYWTPQGVWALLWCNGILVMRIGGYLLTSVAIMLLIMSAVTLMSMRSQAADMLNVGMAVVFQYTATVFVLMGWQTWLSYALKRTEITKPLPFAGWAIVLMEVLPAAIILVMFLTGFWVLCSLAMPSHLPLLTFNYAIGACLALPLSLALMLVTLINPDPGDYTQRFLLTLLIVPALLVAATPTILAVVVGLALGLSFWLNALIVAVVNVGVAWVLVRVAGEVYQRMNPTD